MTAHDVFVSCAPADQAVADAVCARLESAHQLRCWMASRDVPEGAFEAESSLEALDQSKVMVLIFSGPDTTSMPIAREVARAVQQGINILPFRVDPDGTLDRDSPDVRDPDGPSAPMDLRVARLAERVSALIDGSAPSKARSKAGDPSWSVLAVVGGAAFLTVLLVFALRLPGGSEAPDGDSVGAPSTAIDAATGANAAPVPAAAAEQLTETAELAPTSPTGLDMPVDASPSTVVGRTAPPATLDEDRAAATGSGVPSPDRGPAPTQLDRGPGAETTGRTAGSAMPMPDSAAASANGMTPLKRLPPPGEPGKASELTMSGTLLIDFVNSLPDGTVELEIDGQMRWSERLKLGKPSGALAALKLQRASEQLGSELRVAAGDHKITVTILNGVGEVWDFGTTSLHVDASRPVTLRIRLSRFRNRLRLESAAG